MLLYAVSHRACGRITAASRTACTIQLIDPQATIFVPVRKKGIDKYKAPPGAAAPKTHETAPVDNALANTINTSRTARLTP